jgi:DNA topoisomerase IB
LPTATFRPRAGTRKAASNTASRALPRGAGKYEHVVAFADELSSIREKVREHMALRGLPREKVLATVVHLLESRHRSLKPEEAAVLASLRGRLGKEAEGSRRQRPRTA